MIFLDQDSNVGALNSIFFHQSFGEVIKEQKKRQEQKIRQRSPIFSVFCICILCIFVVCVLELSKLRIFHTSLVGFKPPNWPFSNPFIVFWFFFGSFRSQPKNTSGMVVFQLPQRTAHCWFFRGP